MQHAKPAPATAARGHSAPAPARYSTGPNRSGDPLMPSEALLPLSDTCTGGQVPLGQGARPDGVDRVRPYVAATAVIPIECGKHDTTSTRWTENEATQESKDGEVVPDTVPVTHTDT